MEKKLFTCIFLYLILAKIKEKIIIIYIKTCNKIKRLYLLGKLSVTAVQLIALIYVGFSVYFIFFADNLYNFALLYNSTLIDHAIRSLFLLIPSSIAVFTFTSKERKDASRYGMTTNNIWTFILVLIFSMFTFTTFILAQILNSYSEQMNPFYRSLSGILMDFGIHKTIFAYGFINLIITIVLFVFNIIKLIQSLNVEKSLNSSIRKTEKVLNNILILYKYKIGSQKRKNKLLTSFAKLNESNFQLLATLIDYGYHREVSTHTKRLFGINRNLVRTIILPATKDDLISFINFKTSSQKQRKDSYDSIELMINIYTSILTQYGLLVNISSNKKLTVLQEDLIQRIINCGPLSLLDSTIDYKENSILEKYGTDICKIYFESIFYIITNSNNGDLLRYSYLTQLISEYEEPFFVIKSEGIIKGSPLHSCYYKNLIKILDSIIMWSVESNSITHLTESINTLLKIKDIILDRESNKKEKSLNEIKTKPKNPKMELIEAAKKLNEYLKGDGIKKIPNDFIENIVEKKSLTNNTAFKNLSDKESNEVYRDLIKIVNNALLKSIELSLYSISGYLIKIFVTNFNIEKINSNIESFYYDLFTKKNITANHAYFHYSFATHSKKYCAQKLLILITLQKIYKKENFSHNSFLSKEINEDDFVYLLSKVKKAGDKYGLLAINDETMKLLKYYYLSNAI